MNFAVIGSQILLHPLRSSGRGKPSRKIALNLNGEVNCRELARRPWSVPGSSIPQNNMSTHLTIKNENRPNPRTTTPEKKDVSSWGYDLFCG